MKGEKAYSKAQTLFDNSPVRPKDNTDEAKALYQEAIASWYNAYYKALQKAAWAGHPEAQNAYAMEFEETETILTRTANKRHDFEKAFYWYNKAGEQGLPDAFNNLGRLYFGGKGCKKSIKKALALFKMAADAGSSSGKENYKETLRDIKKGKLTL